MAFGFAQDTTKQLITLAVGIVGLTVTFVHTLAAHASSNALHVLEASWFAYFVSVVFGIWTLQQLTGHLEKKAEEGLSIYAPGIKLTALLHVASFLVGTLLVALFGFLAAGSLTP